eukprot:gene6994-7208_t
MAALLGKIPGLSAAISGFLADPAKLEPIIGQAFSRFDKDNSGSIDGPEVKACVQQVLSLAGIKNIPESHIDTVFNKVAGPDAKLDKVEFTTLITTLLNKSGQAPAPASSAEAAAAATPQATGAPAAAAPQATGAPAAAAPAAGAAPTT